MKTKILALIFTLLFTIAAYAQQTATIDAGRTSSSIDVSPTGAATYTIPIAVPPGINGVMPQIALSYNSQSGNGLAGYGWNVSGVSVISRVAATVFHDGFVGSINFDANDRFALDGQRLILKSGVYGAEGAEYETEYFSNLKIKTRESGTYGARYFEVYFPDGTISYYGFSSLGRIPTDYPVIVTVNPLGLRINYSYYNENNAWYIEKISYGTNNVDSRFDINEVNFVYEARQRNEQAYVGGTATTTTKILTEINVKGNGVGYRNYMLKHDVVENLNYQRLKKVQELSGDKTKAFEPIEFNYGTSANTVIQNPKVDLVLSSPVSSNTHQIMSSDFNGDGRIDFVIYPLNKAEINIRVGESNNVTSVNTGTFEDIFSVTRLNENNKQIHGQGIALVKEVNASTIKFEVLSTTGEVEYVKQLDNLPVRPPFFSEFTNTYVPARSVPQKFLSGDFNGDGLTDLLAINRSYFVVTSYTRECNKDGCQIKRGGYNINTSKVNFINLDRRLTNNFVKDAGNLQVSFDDVTKDKLCTGDFNGDGKTDIFHFKPGTVYVYNLTPANDLQLIAQFSNPDINLDYPALLGDYNGDGKIDFIFQTKDDDSKFASFLSTGTTFSHTNVTFPFKKPRVLLVKLIINEYGNIASGESHFNLFPYDVNGDGKTDFVESNNVYYYGATTSNGTTVTKPNDFMSIKVYNNIGWGALQPVNFVLATSSPKKIEFILPPPLPIFLNQNSPNTCVEFGFISNFSIETYGLTKDIRKDFMLDNVVQDGVIHTLEYSELIPKPLYQLSMDEIGYEASNKQAFPNKDIEKVPGFKVVTKLNRLFNGSTSHQVFGYRGAVSNTQGLGFLGFTENIRSTWFSEDNPNKQYNINVNNPLLRSALIKSFVSKNHNIGNVSVKDAVASLPTLLLSTPVSEAQINTATQSITLNPGFLANGVNGVFVAQITNPATGINDGATSTSDYISRTDYTYDTQLLSNKVFKNTLTSVATKNQLDGTNTTIAYTYDTFNNITQEFSNFSGQGTKTVDATYQNIPTTPYVIGRPLTKKITLNNSGDVYSTEEEFIYTGFLATTIKKKGHNTPFITDVLVYDGFGNITNKTTTTASGLTRTVAMQYYPDGRFLKQQTDVEGLITTYDEYNTSNGNLKKQTNPYGQISTSDYDVWGRLKYSSSLGVNADRIYSVSGSSILKTEKDNTGLEKQTIINALGQTIEEKSKNVFSQWQGTRFEFDELDRPFKQSEPAYGGAYTQWTQTIYDEYSRPKTIIAFTGKSTTINYEKLTTTINDGQKTTTTTKNAIGNLIETSDPGGTIKNTYYANGNLKTADYASSVQSLEYDGWGRKTKLTDPSAGVYTYEYYDFGETKKETTPKGITTYNYDATGKLTGKTITGSGTSMVYVYNYNSDKLLSSLNLTTPGNNTTYTYSYDALKRPFETIEDNIFAKFTKKFTYDAFGRLDLETSTALNKTPNKTATKTLKNNYQNGQLLSISDVGTGTTIWKVNSVNARGQVTTANLGTAINQTNEYDEYGLPKQILTEQGATQLLNLTYKFNALTGTLTTRTNSTFKFQEKFSHDNLDRLTKTDILENGIAKPSQSQTYDLLGRTTSNNTLGTYQYASANSYQQKSLTSINPTALTAYQAYPSQEITYNAFKSPVEIYREGKEQISFLYNAGLDRSTMYYGGTQLAAQRRYRRHYSQDGSMEITNDTQLNTTSFVFYLGGDAYTAPAIWKEVHTATTFTPNLFYLHRDYQGTILQITNAAGIVQENRLFDAWGNIIKITDGNNAILTAFVITDRGYTGHEHLLSVGLIHMNGRLYDPLLHRFLSPDNYVQDETNTQCYNRYGYVFNNPLTHIDPDGEEPVLIILGIAGLLGGGLNVWSNWDSIVKNPWSSIGYFASGAAGAVVTITSANPWLGGSITAGGNLATDVAFGNLPKLQNPFDYIKYAGGLALDGLGAAGAGQLTNVVAQKLTYWSYQAGARASLLGTGGGEGFINGTKHTLATPLAELAAGQAGKIGIRQGSTAFFEGAKYSDKVIRQMGKTDDILHAFPKSVDGFASKLGEVSTKIGGDGKTYQLLQLKGSYGGKTGVFEYIKDSAGEINHRFFKIF